MGGRLVLQFDGFDWDDGNWPKCGKHGLEKLDIELLFRSASLRIEPAPPGTTGEYRWIAIGMTPTTERWILVVFTRRGPEPRVRPLSARPMHQKEILKHVTG